MPYRSDPFVITAYMPARRSYMFDRMTRRFVEIDDAALDAAREALDTHTIKNTVDAALRAAAMLALRRRHLDRFGADGLPDLRDGEVMGRAWR